MEKSSRILGIVIAALVTTAASLPYQASANSWSVVVIGSRPGGGYGSGGGGGYFGGGSTTDYCATDYNRCADPPDHCSVLYADTPADCDPRNPPPRTVNGCTKVPDFLIQNPLLGGVFTRGCNRHDECYGAFGANKDQCDDQLAPDMIAAARESMSPADWAIYEPHVLSQAAMYATAIKAPGSVASGISVLAFLSAQKEAECRHRSWMMQTEGCL